MNQNQKKKTQKPEDTKFNILMIFNPMLWILASLTLGLAPWTPEPHIVGKVRWILGGANGMKPMDWFDFCMHGFPILMLIITIVLMLMGKVKFEFKL